MTTGMVKRPTPEKIAELKAHLGKLQSIQWDFTLLQRDMITKGNQYGAWHEELGEIENHLFEVGYLLEHGIEECEGRVH